ncbi:hypothetical protein [Candidatus Kryptobacter tengchongensis]|uniref:hypothetical protein n=1 Tax=Kryptobacter tengchongensis TaxID=1643429 RepID=UPI0007078DCB|nr:hypothetical protein [Candidatus Kryptobacter tengchongensis]CUS93186.1 hypothetical protein JGI20_01549 [Candidatus Kryptobacter tengchongensis]
MRWFKIKQGAIFLFFFLLNQPILPQEAQKENVKFLLDTWKYNFGWKTLGGGYIRHILLFTNSSIIDMETDEISNTPNYSSGSHFNVLSEISNISSEKELIILPPALMLNAILNDLLPSPEERTNKEIEKVINLASEDPTVENFTNAIKMILKGSKVKQIWKYREIEDVEVKRKDKEVHLKFKFNNKKHEFISKYANVENSEKIEAILKKLFDIEKVSKTNEESYLSVYSQEKSVYTQEESVNKKEYAKSSLYVEILGQGLFLSANHDYRFRPNSSIRVGIGLLPVISFGFGVGFGVIFPVTINLLTGSESSHHLEFGGGATFVLIFPLPTLNLGYRYQPKNGGFFFRLAFTPIFDPYFEDGLSSYFYGPDKKSALVLIGGISIGYTFRK